MASSNELSQDKKQENYQLGSKKCDIKSGLISEDNHLSFGSFNYGSTIIQNENTISTERIKESKGIKPNKKSKSILNSEDKSEFNYPLINNDTFDKAEVQPYCFLVISALYHLYYDNETDKTFMTTFLNKFAKDKKIQIQEKEILEMMLVKGEFGIDPIEMHISAVKNTSIYQKYGTEIFIHNLILNSIKDGVYDSREKTLIKYLAYKLMLEDEEDDNNNQGNIDDQVDCDDDDEGGVSDDGDSGCHDTDVISIVCQYTKEDQECHANNNNDDKSDVDNVTTTGDGIDDVENGSVRDRILISGNIDMKVCSLNENDNEHLALAGKVDEDKNVIKDSNVNENDEELKKKVNECTNECLCCSISDAKHEFQKMCLKKRRNNEGEEYESVKKDTEDKDDKKNSRNGRKSESDRNSESDKNSVVNMKEKRKLDKYMLLSRNMVERMEDQLQIKFLNMAYEQTKKEKDEKIKRDSNRKYKKIAMIGLVSIGGGVLIGLTAGLAAPLVAGGLGLTAGAVGSVLFATKAGLAVVGSLFGLAGAGLTGHKMNKRVGDLDEFEFEELTEGRSLTVTLAITGWLNEKYTGFRKVWLGLDNSAEQYVLVYESKHMRELGDSLGRFTDMGISLAMSHGLGYTALSGLVQAMMWPMALLNMAEVIDNPWTVCTKRSSLAGEHLADVLLAREQGNRPVCLIGFGVGARVIFSCLQEMAKRENCEGIVEEAILLGAPVTADPEQWKKLERVVSGRIVNGYSRSDWLLRFIFRTASAQLTVAGLQPIEWEHRIMQNLNLKSIVSSHFDYMERIDEILAMTCVKSKQRVPVKHMSSLAQWTSLKQQKSPGPQVKGELNKNSNQPAMA